MSATDPMGELREALADPNVSIRLVPTFTHGRAAQVYVKSRKVGPLIVPQQDQTLAEVLHMLGTLAPGGAS
jgi:hypothetical protein